MAQTSKKSTSKKKPRKAKVVVAKQVTPVRVAKKKLWYQKAQKRLDQQAWYTRATALTATPRFGSLFARISVAILAISVVFWAILSAQLERFNADQLIDSYLFQNAKTFHDASFPGAHTFLLKWPLFAFMQLLGHSDFSFVFVTVLLVLLTVGTLVWLLHKLERRPVVFGTLCLALASILLLVPAQPAPGDLLPVNLAMITTRNIEYIVYLLSIYLLVKAPRIRSRYFWASAAVAAVLMASDKLFVALYVGGALLAAILYLLVDFKESRPKITAIRRWFLSGFTAYILATLLLKAIAVSGLTHIVSVGSTSPYAAVNSVKHLIEAIIFGIGAAFTNFGANPAHAEVVVRSIPHALAQSFTHPSIIAYLVNFVIFGTTLAMSVKIMRRNLLLKDTLDVATRFVLILLWSTIAAFVVFVATNHYYPVDARYVTIELFALMSAAALYLRSRKVRLEHSVVVALLIVLSLPFGVWGAWHEYTQSRSALSARNELSHDIANQLPKYNVGTLIGDYWYVTPVKTVAKSALTIVPMSGCTTPQVSLSSTAWLQAPKHQTVAYLLVRDAGKSTYGGCTAAQIVAYLGAPTTQVTVTGSVNEPGDALLWIYSDGIKSVLRGSHAPPVLGVNPAGLTVAKPVPLSQSDYCKEPGVDTVMNVVAHEDDDLLFMSPDLLHVVHSGQCVTTVYLTAGDAGGGTSYWQSREFGAEAAYSNMYGASNVWRQVFRTVNGHQISVEYLSGVPEVTLVSLALPDGDMRGEGFSSNNSESLTRLRNANIATIHSLDGKSSYTKQDLVKTITSLLNLYQPAEIHTQDYNPNQNDGDHSDHHATGYFTKLAYAAYTSTTPSILKAYAGYPVRAFPVNVSAKDEQAKVTAFLAYALYDPAVCQNLAECQHSAVYNGYLNRQYYVVDGTRP